MKAIIVLIFTILYYEIIENCKVKMYNRLYWSDDVGNEHDRIWHKNISCR